MRITLDLPEDIAAHLAAQGENLSRAALEAFALEAYRARKLSTAQLRRLLGYHTRTQVHAFLKEHGVYLHYTQDDLEHDRQAGDAFRQQPLVGMIVIADSTPLNYLILIHQVNLLPQLFDRILIPPAVFEELQHQETPDVVRRWIAGPPSWLQVRALRSVLDPALGFLDAGEREAIALAEELQADQLLLDDADARREAARRNLPFIGTLGVLREAARRELLDLRVVLVQLQETSFFVDPALIESLLDEEARRRQQS